MSDENCLTLPDGSCVSPNPCIHSTPPVGATVTHPNGSIWERRLIAPPISYPWWYCGVNPASPYQAPLITLAWRMQQRAEQAEATRDLVTLDNIRLVAELAKLRALAVEAKALLATESYRTAKQPAAHLLFRLAALATPNQEPTP